MNCVNISSPSGALFPNSRPNPIGRCPMCGAKTDNEELPNGSIEEITPCEHLAFILPGDINEFHYMTLV
jgi:hypothetical protein